MARASNCMLRAMPGKLLAVPGRNTIYATFQASPFDDEKPSALTDLRYDAQKRGPKVRASYGWTHSYGWWPCASGFYSDPAAPANAIMSQEMTGSGAEGYGPWESHEAGSQNLKFIMGVCYDSVGGTVSGAVVQGFLTSNDRFVRETTADSNGRYELGTEYASPTQHYLVSYRSGAPDISGTTVNTLTATNRDGS